MATGTDDSDCAAIWGDFVDSDDECDVEDAAEPAKRYNEGLYYPICIGEILINKYRVEHKLGYGGFSTVWMAHDMVNNVDIALKIMTPGPSAEREYTAQNMIASTVQDTSRLLIYRDTFLLPAPKTNYRETVTLADFGLAVKSDTSVECEGEPPAIYCAPERFHGVESGFASDMWSYMCIFADLCIGFSLFRGSITRSALDFMVKSLGPLPSTWKDSYDGGGQCDESWYDQNRVADSHQTLEAKVERSRYKISPMEKRLVLSILQRGLSYPSDHRFSADQLLEDASFKELMALHGL